MLLDVTGDKLKQERLPVLHDEARKLSVKVCRRFVKESPCMCTARQCRCVEPFLVAKVYIGIIVILMDGIWGTVKGLSNTANDRLDPHKGM